MRPSEDLERVIKIKFNNKKLLEQALRHKSFVVEEGDQFLEDNERLEFLGDSVLNLVISDYLYKVYREHSEGDLAKIRAVVVSSAVLAEAARKMNLGSYIFLGRGEELTGGRNRENLLADTLEAVIGAIYLDQGFVTARSFILNYLENEIRAVETGEHIQDFKTLLQEITQKRYNILPEYRVIKEEGPEHNKKFVVRVVLNDQILGQGAGTSKKEAEQKAAKKAVEELE